MIRAVHHFPQGFLWGTATAAHQVEGENHGNDWSKWEAEPGRILEGHRAGKACDWWGGRWQEDFDRAAESGQNAHRLSIEWSRVEPEPGTWDEAALDFYEGLIRGARERGLEPLVTLHHFTNPIWLADAGGWLSDDVPKKFETYARKVASRLRDHVSLWVTINEPNAYAYAAYSAGTFPPGTKREVQKAFKVMENMVRAHAAAYRALHEVHPDCQVGFAHHYRGMYPSRPRNPLDVWVARIRFRVFNSTIPGAARNGRLRFLTRTIQIPEAAGTQDFLGLNYYTEEKVAFDPRFPGELFGRGFFPEGSEVSSTGFIANEPEGFWRALSWAKAYGLPIIVTENGVDDPTDKLRRRYLILHLRQLWRAANLSWKIRGYFHWTLVDNFEWERGWTQRFGLWELDPETQERRKRPSADLYAEICRTGSLSSEMVERFAPEIHATVFPTDSPGYLQ